MIKKSVVEKIKYLFLLFIFEAVVLSIIAVHFDQRATYFLEEDLHKLEVQYKAAMEENRAMTDKLAQLVITPEVIDIFSRVPTAAESEKARLREALHQELADTYAVLKQIPVQQFFFHLSDGEGFLRFHRPQMFGDNLLAARYSVGLANCEKRSVHGFEEGKLFNGIRNVYPLFDRGNRHIGSMEISYSVKTIADKLHRIYDSEIEFLVKQSIVDEKILAKERSKFSHSLLTRGYLEEYLHADTEHEHLGHRLIEKIKHAIKKEVARKIVTKEPFVVPANVGGTFYSAIFLPINNVEGERAAAYMVAYKKAQTYQVAYEAHKTLAVFSTIFLIMAVTFFYKMSKTRELEESERLLYNQANYDSLTKLPNRLLFNDRLNHAIKIAKRHDERLALLFIDLDRFKEINDTLGHDAGDETLVIIAEKLLGTLRDIDTIARLGGDEFTVIVESIKDPNVVQEIAGKLIAALQEPIVIEAHEFYLTSSIGISLYPDDGADASTLLRNADTAMYKAKSLGRNNYQFYTEEMTTQAFSRVVMASNLRQAIENNELLLHYQPQVNSINGEIIGLEALVRWQHREMGLISPASFIPLAEETGLILPLGDWVLREVARQRRVWRKQGLEPGRIAVNLSGKQLQQESLIPILKDVLKEGGSDREWLGLEVTEGYIMEHPERSIQLMHEIKELGIEFSVDDFGTGYSSLAYLKRLPIDKLKIDRSFIRDIPGDDDGEAIVNSIISLSTSLKLDVIAEGVETEQQKDFLMRHGCPNIQGYYYAKPMNAKEVGDYIMERFINNG